MREIVASVFAKSTKIKQLAYAGTLQSSVRMLQQHKPRLVLLDWGLGKDGITRMLNKLSTVTWACDGLIVAGENDPLPDLEVFRGGAVGFVRMQSIAEELPAHVDAVLAGGSPIDPMLARQLILSIKEPGPQVLPSVLTPREREVLKLLADGIRREDVARALGITHGTAGNHIASIYRKLEVTSNVQAISAATRLGII